MSILTKAERPVNIIADGAMSNPLLGEGRFIPWIIIDCREYPEISNLIDIHKDSPPGDVISQWGSPIFAKKILYLVLKFKFPMEIEFTIKFDINRNFNLIDLIINARGMYLQSGMPGDKVSDKINHSKILIEIPDEGFPSLWNKRALTILSQRYIKRGLSKFDARKSAEAHLKNLRQLGSARKPSQGPASNG